LHNSDGDPLLLYALRNDYGSWFYTNYDYPDNKWNRSNGFAFVVSQVSQKLLYLLIEEFCFTICPNQPPSIRPTSSILSEIIKYFLLSSDLVSQSIRNNSFKVSVFRMAVFIYNTFSCLFTYKAPEIISITSIKMLSILTPRLKRCSFGIDLK
jgi:hypothetical protein